MAIGLLAIIGSVAVAIWDGVKYVGERAFELARELFKFLLEGFKWFLNTAPRPVQILFFLLFILLIANTVVGFFVQTNFACTSGDELREYESMIGGFQGYWTMVTTNMDNSSTNYDTFINESTFPSNKFGDGTSHKDVFNVGCSGGKPVLRFFMIPFLDYKVWVLLIIIGFMVQIGLGLRK